MTPRAVPGIVTIEIESAVGVDQVLRRVVGHVEALGLEIFTVIDHSGEADEAGLSMPETKLVMFGNPTAGTPLMLAHPLVALELPLKLLIWASADDRVFVSYNEPTFLADRFGLTAGESAVVGVVEKIARQFRPSAP